MADVYFALPVDQSTGGCCDCEQAVDACTCCPSSLGQTDIDDEGPYACGEAGPPCNEEGGDCSDIEFEFRVDQSGPPFKTKCLEKFTAKAYVNFITYNEGSMFGPDESVDYFEPDSYCGTGGSEGTITAFTEEEGEESIAYVMVRWKTPTHGGASSFVGSATFFLEAT